MVVWDNATAWVGDLWKYKITLLLNLGHIFWGGHLKLSRPRSRRFNDNYFGLVFFVKSCVSLWFGIQLFLRVREQIYLYTSLTQFLQQPSSCYELSWTGRSHCHYHDPWSRCSGHRSRMFRNGNNQYNIPVVCFCKFLIVLLYHRVRLSTRHKRLCIIRSVLLHGFNRIWIFKMLLRGEELGLVFSFPIQKTLIGLISGTRI